jgi:hypothetical protein
MRTLAYLALRADDNGVCWPSVVTIARERGISRSQTFEHLRLLADAELIRREDRVGSRVKACRLLMDTSGVPDPSDTADDARPASQTLSVRSDRTQKENSESITEGGAPPMSQAQDDLGGLAPPPMNPTPEQILSRRFPAQCSNHQSGKNDDKCAACGNARTELPEIRAAAARARRQRELDTERAREAQRAALAANCPECNGTQRRADMSLCRVCDPDWQVVDADAAHAGFQQALEAIRGAA